MPDILLKWSRHNGNRSGVCLFVWIHTYACDCMFCGWKQSFECQDIWLMCVFCSGVFRGLWCAIIGDFLELLLFFL